MNNTEIRIAAAELCGWSVYSPGDFNPTPRWINTNGSIRPQDELPDYPNDLNAMHEAEKMLEGATLWNRYTDELGRICGYKSTIHDLRSFANIIALATALQRVEAFLRVFGKWKE